MATRDEIEAEIHQWEEVLRRNMLRTNDLDAQYYRSGVSDSKLAELREKKNQIDRENHRCWAKIDQLRAQLEKLPN